MSSGRVLVIKIKYQDDVRRISFKEMPSFKKVRNTLQKLFTYLSLSDFVIKYVDEESDLVTISSDMELNEAVSQSTKLLRLYLVEQSRAPTITASTLGVSTLNPNEPLNTSQPVIHASTLMRMPTLNNPSGAPSGPSFQQLKIEPNPNANPPLPGSNPAMSAVWNKLAVENPQLAKQLWASKLAALPNSASVQTPTPMEVEPAPINVEPTPMKVEPPSSEAIPPPTASFAPIEPEPTPEPLPEPVQPAPVEAAPKKKKSDIRYLARFVKNVTVPDATEIATGQTFTKIWEMRNDGEHPWPAGTKLTFVGGDALSSVDHKEIEGEVAASESVEIAVHMTTPSEPGRYVSYWRLVTPDGNRFGHRVWVDVLVVAGREEPEELEVEEIEEPVESPPLEEPTQEPSAPPAETPAQPQAEVQAPTGGPAKPPVTGATKDALRVLADMGFTNTELCTALLYRNNNNLMVTIQDLLQGKYK